MDPHAHDPSEHAECSGKRGSLDRRARCAPPHLRRPYKPLLNNAAQGNRATNVLVPPSLLLPPPLPPPPPPPVDRPRPPDGGGTTICICTVPSNKPAMFACGDPRGDPRGESCGEPPLSRRSPPDARDRGEPRGEPRGELRGELRGDSTKVSSSASSMTCCRPIRGNARAASAREDTRCFRPSTPKPPGLRPCVFRARWSNRGGNSCEAQGRKGARAVDRVCMCVCRPGAYVNRVRMSTGCVCAYACIDNVRRACACLRICEMHMCDLRMCEFAHQR